MTVTQMNSPETRYAANDLIEFSKTLLLRAGIDKERAQVVAGILVEGDLMGHTTHGLMLLPAYLNDLESGKMKREGFPITLTDTGATITWDGQYLPGPWLTVKALELAFERISKHPVVTIAIQKSHHIACLAAYPEFATKKNLFMLLTCTDPSVRSVAPFGGIEPVYTPNPIAAGIPTKNDPIIIDISVSSVANGVVSRAFQLNKRLSGKWIQDNQGIATDDPKAFFSDPPGTVLPLGGELLGYKGFALGLLMEALTAGLSGHGRSNDPKVWGASVFLQIINPDAFGGLAHYLQEMEWLGKACTDSAVKNSSQPVRLPGSRGLRLKKEQMESGVELDSGIIEALKKLSKKYEIDMVTAIP